MLGFLLALSIATFDPGSVVSVAEPVHVQGAQDPAKPKPAPKPQPKPAPTPSSGGSAGRQPAASRPSPSARPQTPRGGQSAPKATGEPRLKRRGN